MPRDSILLPEWSQQLLRAARAGRLFEPPSNKPDGGGDGTEAKKSGESDDAMHRSGQQCVKVKKWSRVPRHLEEPEKDYLAKRRKGLPSLRNGIAGSLGFGGAMRKTKIRKVDSEGNSNVWQVLVPEGQAVEGEITNEEESNLAIAKPTAPGTVVEGVGAVNSDGLIVVNDELLSAPPRRRPPPPRRKPKKGPGRGRKKVLFKPGEQGAESKAGIPTFEAQRVAASGSVPTMNEAQGQDKDITMADMPEADENEEDGEDEEDEGEVDEGEEDDDDREEGELSSSSPGPSENQVTMDQEPQQERGSIPISEAFPKPKLHPLPPAPPAAASLPLKPMSAEASDSLPHMSSQQQQHPGQAGSSASGSALAELHPSRAQAMGRDREAHESRQPVSLVPQHLFGASIPPAPKPQHSSTAPPKSMNSPIPDSSAENATAATSDLGKSASSKAAKEISMLPLGETEPRNRRMLSSSPDLPLAQTASHSRNNSLNSTIPMPQQERLNGRENDARHSQRDSKDVEMTDQGTDSNSAQDDIKQGQPQASEPGGTTQSQLDTEVLNEQPCEDSSKDYNTEKSQKSPEPASRSAPLTDASRPQFPKQEAYDELMDEAEAFNPSTGDIDAALRPSFDDLPNVSASSPSATSLVSGDANYVPLATTNNTLTDVGAAGALPPADAGSVAPESKDPKDTINEEIKEAQQQQPHSQTQQTQKQAQDNPKESKTTLDLQEQKNDQAVSQDDGPEIASGDAADADVDAIDDTRPHTDNINNTSAASASASAATTATATATATTKATKTDKQTTEKPTAQEDGAAPTNPGPADGNAAADTDASNIASKSDMITGDVDLLGTLEQRLNAKEAE